MSIRAARSCRGALTETAPIGVNRHTDTDEDMVVGDRRAVGEVQRDVFGGLAHAGDDRGSHDPSAVCAVEVDEIVGHFCGKGPPTRLR